MKNYIIDGIKKLFDKEVIIMEPPKAELGDYCIQCSNLKDDNFKNPIEIAAYIKDNFDDKDNLFLDIKTMGPYVNFYLDYAKFSKEVILKIESEKNKYGSLNQGKGKSMLIEHTSINPNAEPHIGRIRNSFIGDFIYRLYSFTGYDVKRHYFINDLGKKIALLVIGVSKYGLKDDSFSSVLDAYVKISKLAKEDEMVEQLAFEYLEKVEAGDKNMVQKFKDITDKCVAGQMKIFDELDIHFDVFTHESDYVYNHYLSDILKMIDKKGRLHKDELGRYYVDLSGYDIPTKNPVLVLTRSNNTSLYPIKDIAYTIYKMKENSNNNIIVLGEDQAVYMSQISAVMDILGYRAPNLVSYSYVLLEGDKMSTSNGTVVLVTDFMKEVTNVLEEELEKRKSINSLKNLKILRNACIKFTMLNVSRKKIVNFNLNKAVSFTGESGIYILYSLVRMNSILKNCGKVMDSNIRFENDIEKHLIKKMYEFPELIESLLKTKEPAHLTKYLFGLAQEFSKFYEQVNISKEEDVDLKKSRLRLLKCLETVITNGLSILGIKTVAKM